MRVHAAAAVAPTAFTFTAAALTAARSHGAANCASLEAGGRSDACKNAS